MRVFGRMSTVFLPSSYRYGNATDAVTVDQWFVESCVIDLMYFQISWDIIRGSYEHNIQQRKTCTQSLRQRKHSGLIVSMVRPFLICAHISKCSNRKICRTIRFTCPRAVLQTISQLLPPTLLLLPLRVLTTLLRSAFSFSSLSLLSSSLWGMG